MSKKHRKAEKKGIFGNATDYSVYHMRIGEVIFGMLAGYALGFVALQVFFQNLTVSLVLSVVLMPVGKKVYRGIRKGQRDRALVIQFKDMLEALTTSYDSGKNTVEAFADAHSDMSVQYGEDAYIVQELALILQGIHNNINIEEMLLDFADRSNNEDIESFADVFEISNRAGGNIRNVISETKDVIADKITIEMEIETLVSGKKNELNIMILLPFIVVTQIQGFGGTSSDSPQSMLISVGCRIIALLIFAIAYVIGQKMVKIKI